MTTPEVSRMQTGRSMDSRWRLVLLVFVGIAAFFLMTEHRAHVLGVLPYLLVLLCPLMHLFLHGGHGGHGGHQEPPHGDAGGGPS